MSVYILLLIMGLTSECVSDRNDFDLCESTTSTSSCYWLDLCCTSIRQKKSEYSHLEQILVNIKGLGSTKSDNFSDFFSCITKCTSICSTVNLNTTRIRTNRNELTNTIKSLLEENCSLLTKYLCQSTLEKAYLDTKNDNFSKEMIGKEFLTTSDEEILEKGGCKHVYCSPELRKVLNDINEDVSATTFHLLKALKKHFCKQLQIPLQKLLQVAQLFPDIYFQNCTSTGRDFQEIPYNASTLDSSRGIYENRRRITHRKLSKSWHIQRRPFFKKPPLAPHSRTTSENATLFLYNILTTSLQELGIKRDAQISSKARKKLAAIKNSSMREEQNVEFKGPQKGDSGEPLGNIRRFIQRTFQVTGEEPNRFLNEEVKKMSIRADTKYSGLNSDGRVGESANTRRRRMAVVPDKKFLIRHEEGKIAKMMNELCKVTQKMGPARTSLQAELRIKRELQPEFITKKVSLAYFESEPKPNEEFFDHFPKDATDEEEEKEVNNKITKASRGTNSLESAEKNHLRHHRNKRRKAAAAVVLAAEGHSAVLPCDVTSRVKNDTPILLMWFREGTHTPLFSVDFRQGTKGLPQVGHDLSSPMTQRAILHVTTQSQFYTKDFLRSSNYSYDDLELFTASGGNLEINPVMRTEEGIYKCRVDFLHSPTRNERVNLTIVIPSRSLELEWRRNGEWITPSGEFLGPLIEGDSLHIVCKASAAWPPPKVIWTSDGVRIDESFDQIPTNSPSHDDVMSQGRHLTGGVNHLQLDQLWRSDHLRQLNCEASNTNFTRPIVRSIILSVALPVLSVTLDKPPTIKAGEAAEVQCTVRGSFPPPIIKWSLGEQEVDASQFWISKDGNVTVSVVQIAPTAPQNGHPLICLAFNPILHAHKSSRIREMKKDSRQINVEFPPEVSARLGKSLNGSRIKEGDDVYFECLVLANPPPHILEWSHDSEKLKSRRGVFRTNGTLVIQKVNVSESGNYSCFAANSEGQAKSGIIRLGVKFAPKCYSNSSLSFSIAKFGNVIIPCNLTANPTNVDFRWSFNNTAEVVDVPKGRYSWNHSISILNYTPMNELDYGTLLCWGSNEVGKQIEPCVFHIKAAGKPEPPHNCRVKQTTLSSLWVTCLPGGDGGDPQIFHLQVQLVSAERRIIAEVTNSSPDFFVANLQPNMRYRLLITAANRRGESHPARELLTRTAKLGTPRQETNAEATRERKTKEDDKRKAVMGITLAGTSAALILLVLVTWACVRRRSRRRQNVRLRLSVETELVLSNPDDKTVTEENTGKVKDMNLKGSNQNPRSSIRTEMGDPSDSSLRVSSDAVQRNDSGVESCELRFYSGSINQPSVSKSHYSKYDSANFYDSSSNPTESPYQINELKSMIHERPVEFGNFDSSSKRNPSHEYSHRIFVGSEEFSTGISDHPSNSSLVPLVKSFSVQSDRRTSVSDGVPKEVTLSHSSTVNIESVRKEPSGASQSFTSPFKPTMQEPFPTSPFYNISGLSQSKLSKLPL